jgi:hypothetical protein
MAGTRQEPNGAPGSIYISLAAVFLVQATRERRCARSDRRGEECSSWHLSRFDGSCRSHVGSSPVLRNRMRSLVPITEPI